MYVWPQAIDVILKIHSALDLSMAVFDVLSGNLIRVRLA